MGDEEDGGGDGDEYAWEDDGYDEYVDGGG